jgi:hypothetical protein
MQKLIAVAVLVFAGCGGSDSIAFDSFPDALRRSFCSAATRCGDFDSEATCLKTNVDGNDPFVSASLAAAIDMGKARFDGGNAQACLDAFSSRSCDLTSKSSRVEPDACLSFFHGTLHAAATCTLDVECASQFCNVPTCDMACCTGTCVGDTAPVRAKLGQPCANAFCDDLSFCDGTSATCVALKASGAACQQPIGECDFGLACVGPGGFGSPGACTTLPKLGEPCTDICRDDGASCSPTSHVCVKVAAVGQACTPAADTCSVYSVCDPATSKCVAGIALGGQCTTAQRCSDDLAFCDVPAGQAMGTCALPKPDGSACGFNNECQSHFCGSTLTCATDPVCI